MARLWQFDFWFIRFFAGLHEAGWFVLLTIQTTVSCLFCARGCWILRMLKLRWISWMRCDGISCWFTSGGIRGSIDRWPEQSPPNKRSALWASAHPYGYCVAVPGSALANPFFYSRFCKHVLVRAFPERFSTNRENADGKCLDKPIPRENVCIFLTLSYCFLFSYIVQPIYIKSLELILKTINFNV